MITKTNTSKIMELFFKYPERKFHLRELERLTKLSLPGVSKILKKLEKEDLLESKKEKVVKNYYAKRNEKFNQLKRSYNLYSIFSSGLLDFLKKEYEEPEAIILFGSYSKAEDISKSDIDIFIYGNVDDLRLAKYEMILKRDIQLFNCNNKTGLNKLGDGLIKNIVKGNLIKGDMDFIRVDINA